MIKPKKYSRVNIDRCVACGTCENECPREAIVVWQGCYAVVSLIRCIGCGRCYQICPAGAITMLDREKMTQEND